MLQLFVILGFVLTGTIASPEATVTPLTVTKQMLGTTDDSSERAYYSFELPSVTVPEGMVLAEAYVTFQMDVDSSLDPEITGGAVTLELYPQLSMSDGKLDVSELPAPSMMRTVTIGDDRPVRMYVTNFVQNLLNNPESDRHLIAGCFKGDRIGLFEANTLESVAALASLSVIFSRVEAPPAGLAEDE